MAICFFSQSETHREFSNFAPFGIDLDDMRWPSVEHYTIGAQVRLARARVPQDRLGKRHRRTRTIRAELRAGV